MLYPEAFHAYAWLAVPFLEPITAHFDLEQALAQTKEALGYEAYAYWLFLLSDEVDNDVRQHVGRRRIAEVRVDD